MAFEISKAFPPNRDSAVVELTVRHDGLVDIPAEIYRENGTLKITLFGREEGVAWKYGFNEFVEALQRAAVALGEE